jgi:Domain of unknown function (DUF3846)
MIVTTFHTDGTISREEMDHTPDLKELKQMIDCAWVERIQVKGRSMWFDEEAKLKRHTPNIEATRFAHAMETGLMPRDYIAGTAVLCGTSANIESYLGQVPADMLR